MLASLLLSLACGPVQEPATPEPPAASDWAPSDWALAVGDEQVPWEEYAAWLVDTRGDSVVSAFVRHELVARAAARAGVAPTDAEVEATIQAAVEERIEKAFAGNRAAFEGELVRVGRTLTGFLARRRIEVRHELAINALVAATRAPTEAEVRGFWELRHGRAGRRLEVRLLRVGIRHERPPVTATANERAAQRAREESQALELARELRRLALAGEDFGGLCEAHSDDRATRAKSGLLTGGFRPEAWTQATVDAVYALEEGGVSEPLQARGAWNLFRVDRIVVTPFESVAEGLRGELVARPANSAETQALFDEIAAATSMETRVPSSATEAWLDAPVVVINGEPVPQRVLAHWMMGLLGEVLAPRFVDDRVVAIEARRLGLTVTDEELLVRIEVDLERRISDLFDGKRERWLGELASRGRTEAEFRRDQVPLVRTQLLVEKLLARDRVIREDEIRNLWHERYGFDGRSLDVRLLRMSSQIPEVDEPIGPEETQRILERERKRITAELEGIRGRVAKGEDFAALLQRYSDDAETRDRGGRLEEGFKPDLWPEPVVAAVEALAPGQVTPPLEMTYSYFLFQLLRERIVALDDVREELRAELLTRRPTSTEISAFTVKLRGGLVARPLPGMFGR